MGTSFWIFEGTLFTLGLSPLFGFLIIPAAIRQIRKRGLLRVERQHPSGKVVQLVIDLLSRDSEWHVEEHRLAHPAGVSIWIANDLYGLALSLTGDAWPSSSDRSNGYPLGEYWKSQLWDAVQGHKARALESRLRRAEQAFGENVIQMFGRE